MSDKLQNSAHPATAGESLDKFSNKKILSVLRLGHVASLQREQLNLPIQQFLNRDISR
jgi:hypothetical protein